MAAVAAVAVGSPPDSALVAGLAGRMATWSVPVLTSFAAAWVVRTAERGTATLHGLLVGLLGAVFFGLHYYWPFNLAALIARPVLFGTAMALAQPRLFGLEVLGEGRWLKALKLEDYAPRKARPGSLQQSLFPYHETWG
jgi:hypothetical protein